MICFFHLILVITKLFYDINEYQYRFDVNLVQQNI